MIYILLFVVYRLLMKDEKTTAAVRSFLLLWWWLFGYILSIKKRAPAAACWMFTSFYLLSWGLIFTTSSWNISLNMMKMDSPRLYKKNGPLYKNYSIECDEPWIPYAWKGFFFFSFLNLIFTSYKFFSSFVGYKVQEWYRNAEIYILKVNINSIIHV